MKITIEIECDNDAFFLAEGAEVARILQTVAERVCDLSEEGFGSFEMSLRDINGHAVGSAKVEGFEYPWMDAASRLERERVIELLEGIGVACFDDESTEELREAMIDSVKSGDIDPLDFT